MNDELSGQLAAQGWRIPRYAQNALYLDSDSGAAVVEGASGLFTLSAPSEKLVLRWGHADGPALAALKWAIDSLAWDGTVVLGGYVDAVHLMTVDEDEGEFVAVIHFGGQPLHPHTPLYTPAAQRRTASYARPDFYAWVDDTIVESSTTWLAAEDSPLLTLAQDAMLNKLRVVFIGRLMEDGSDWDKFLALPLKLESIVLVAP